MVNFGHVTVTNIIGCTSDTSDTPEVSDGCTSERKGGSKLWKASFEHLKSLGRCSWVVKVKVI